MPQLAQWDSFYVIVGSAAGALIGLQFVVMTLLAQSPSQPRAETGAAFGAPTTVHFGAALFLSAAVRMPWPSGESVALLFGLSGLAGVFYAAIVIRRMRRQTSYTPDGEDWLFHALLPLLAYVLILAPAFLLFSHPREALFGVGAAALLLLFIGIHNAWDSVAYYVFVSSRKPPS